MKHHCTCCEKKAKEIAWIVKRIKIFRDVAGIETLPGKALEIILNLITKKFADVVENKE